MVYITIEFAIIQFIQIDSVFRKSVVPSSCVYFLPLFLFSASIFSSSQKEINTEEGKNWIPKYGIIVIINLLYCFIVSIIIFNLIIHSGCSRNINFCSNFQVTRTIRHLITNVHSPRSFSSLRRAILWAERNWTLNLEKCGHFLHVKFETFLCASLWNNFLWI